MEARHGLNAFLAVPAERARAEAKQAEAVVRRADPVGPLHGVPFSAKDLINTEGVATTQGSALFAGTVPSTDAVAVARARAAGAILIGKTTTPEFGHKPFTEGPFFGRTLNPWSEAHTCGGSSGGAAVAVAGGMGPLALGTDGGGSIRIPASCCAIVGLKATLGAIPHLQPPDLFGANSYVGPMARTVADARLLFEAVAGPDCRDPYGQRETPPPRRLTENEQPRIGVLLRCGNRLDPAVEATVVAAMRQAETVGMTAEPIELDLVSLEPHFLVMLRSQLLTRLGAAAKRSPEKRSDADRDNGGGPRPERHRSMGGATCAHGLLRQDPENPRFPRPSRLSDPVRAASAGRGRPVGPNPDRWAGRGDDPRRLVPVHVPVQPDRASRAVAALRLDRGRIADRPAACGPLA